MEKNDLISNEYKKINKKIYSHVGQGQGGAKHAEIVKQLSKKLDAKTILDYGCGQGQFKNALDAFKEGFQVSEYDPAIKGKDHLPGKADLIVCADVLEHIEPDKIDNVLAHIFELMQKGGYFIIALCETKIFLPDGRNAHILLKPVDWWLQKMMGFDCDILHCSVRVKKKQIKDVVLWIQK